MGHLGSRTSALLDGQLPPDEAERAWLHVHACHTCRDQVEREGWVKRRLAGLQHDGSAAPEHLKGSLLGASEHLKGSLLGASVGAIPSERYLVAHHDHRVRRATGLVAIGGGAVGAAVMGVLALGAAPADAPTIDRRVPVTSINGPADTLRSPTPTTTPTASTRRHATR